LEKEVLLMVTYGQMLLAAKAIQTAYSLVKKYQKANKRKPGNRKGDPKKRYRKKR